MAHLWFDPEKSAKSHLDKAVCIFNTTEQIDLTGTRPGHG